MIRPHILVAYPRYYKPPDGPCSIDYFKHCKTEYLLYVPWVGSNFLSRPAQDFKELFESFLENNRHTLSAFHYTYYDRNVLSEALGFESPN